ncbi:Uncharacterised protein [Halioglobus japonicus]|nr:Uncharacterised protein [Halioglobus japonicus]
MSELINTLLKYVSTALLLVPMTAMPAAAQGTPGTPETLGRIIGPETETVVAAIYPQSREISMTQGSAISYTVYAPEQVVNLADVSVGDHILGTYSASVEGDIREPTQADLETPWQVLQEGVISYRDGMLQVDEPRVIQAVVTIAGIDKSGGVFIAWDSRRRPYFLAHVEAEKLAALAVHQQVVVVFSEAMAITFNKQR